MYEGNANWPWKKGTSCTWTAGGLCLSSSFSTTFLKHHIDIASSKLLQTHNTHTNQINSWFSVSRTTRMMKHYIVQFSSISAASYSTLSETRIFLMSTWKLAWNASTWEFCWNLISCSRSSDDRERPLTKFQTGPGYDIIAVRCISKSQSRWDIGNCSQHTSEVGCLHGLHTETKTAYTIQHGRRSVGGQGDMPPPYFLKWRGHPVFCPPTFLE